MWAFNTRNILNKHDEWNQCLHVVHSTSNLSLIFEAKIRQHPLKQLTSITPSYSANRNSSIDCAISSYWTSAILWLKAAAERCIYLELDCVRWDCNKMLSNNIEEDRVDIYVADYAMSLFIVYVWQFVLTDSFPRHLSDPLSVIYAF
eukprot:357055_1